MNHLDIILGLKDAHMEQLVKKTPKSMVWSFGRFSVKVTEYRSRYALKPNYYIYLHEAKALCYRRWTNKEEDVLKYLNEFFGHAKLREAVKHTYGAS